MYADLLSEIPEKILSQCGLVSALLVIAVIWLTIQLAKTRASWEQDRSEMMDIARLQNESFDNLVVSNAKLEGMLLAFQRR